MKTKLVLVFLFCLLSINFVLAAGTYESVVGTWDTSGSMSVKVRGISQGGYFSDTFTFNQGGTFATIETGKGSWYQVGTRIAFSMSNQEVINVINGYFDDWGYGDEIQVSSIQRIQFTGKLCRGVLSGKFKWSFYVSAPNYGFYNLKASLAGSFSGTRRSEKLDSSEMSSSDPYYILAKQIVEMVKKGK